MNKIIAFIAYRFYKCVLMIFQLFPLQDKVLFSNFSGKRYGDNPKYISDALHERDPQCRILWQRHYKHAVAFDEYVEPVKWISIRCMYELATSKVWVDSHLKKEWMTIRKGQHFIETWHGGLGFKKIEGDVDPDGKKEETRDAYQTAKMADVFVSNSTWLSDIYRRAFRYEGEILEVGYPKNDIFFRDNTETRAKVHQFLQIPEDVKIVLYAPTFRDKPRRQVYDLDFEQILEAFEERFGCRCVLVTRLHPVMIKLADQWFTYSDRVINGTEYPDAQEIVLASDYMITDYSSIIFDFMLTGRPGFLFTPDLEEYRKERGFYYEMEEYPFPYAADSAGVAANIRCFDEQQYREKAEKFEQKTGLKEQGDATEKIVDLIMEYRKL